MRRPLSYAETTRSFRIWARNSISQKLCLWSVTRLFRFKQESVKVKWAVAIRQNVSVIFFLILKMLSLTNNSHGQPSVRLQFSLCQKVTSEVFLCLSLLLLLNRLNMINERVLYKIKKLPVLQVYLWLCVILPYHLKYAHRTRIPPGQIALKSTFFNI